MLYPWVLVGPACRAGPGPPDEYAMSTPLLTPDEINKASDRLREATAQEVLRWAVKEFFPRLTMATAFGAEGCCLIHMLAEIEPGVRIFNLETGYQFAETLELRERIRKRYGIAV